MKRHKWIVCCAFLILAACGKLTSTSDSSSSSSTFLVSCTAGDLSCVLDGIFLYEDGTELEMPLILADLPIKTKTGKE